jgi:SAM-dependent methyltransferase
LSVFSRAFSWAPRSDVRQTFGGSEFDTWAWRQGLIPPERILIERYLTPSGHTLEAGTGGGRILRALAQSGFTHLAGFDIVPELIDAARQQDPSHSINYRVLDARRLSYSDQQFDQLIYLQQVLCFLPTEADRSQALAGAYRVLKPAGIAVFSFLCYEARLQLMRYKALAAYLTALRSLRGRRALTQIQPILMRGGALNLSILLDRPPYVYWFRCGEALDFLRRPGFSIVGFGTRAQVESGGLCTSLEELLASPKEGMLYVVCRK